MSGVSSDFLTAMPMGPTDWRNVGLTNEVLRPIAFLRIGALAVLPGPNETSGCWNDSALSWLWPFPVAEERMT